MSGLQVPDRSWSKRQPWWLASASAQTQSDPKIGAQRADLGARCFSLPPDDD